MQNNDRASDTERPNHSGTGEGKEPVTHLKRLTRPKPQQHHLYTQHDEQVRKQQIFDFVQIVCQTDNSEFRRQKKFEIVVSGNLFDSTDSIAESISSDFKLAARIGKQVWEEFPSTNPEFWSKASEEKTFEQQISPKRFIHQLLAKPRFWNKPTYSSLHTALEAMLHQVQNYKGEEISVPKLSTGLDKLNWLKVEGIITNVFLNQPINVMAFAQPEQQNARPSGNQKGKGAKNDTQQAQEENLSLSTVFCWAKKVKQSHRSVLESQ